jgi:hypothetical protein
MATTIVETTKTGNTGKGTDPWLDDRFVGDGDNMGLGAAELAGD